MYCPKCATPAAGEQKFCRSCGLPLQLHTLLLSDQPEESEALKSLSELAGRLQSRRTKLLLRGLMIMLTGLMAGSLFLAAEGLQKYLAGFADLVLVILGLSGVFLFAGIMVLVYAVFLPQISAERKPAQPQTTASAETTNPLASPPHPASLPSVTEPTTELLKPAAPTPARDTAC
jgi:hypothetical protein